MYLSLSLSLSLGLWRNKLTHVRLSLAADLTTSMPWIVCCANIACPFGRTVRGALNKQRPDAVVTPVYLVGRPATSGRAIRKILPPDVPKVVLIGLPTRIVAAGIPHYTTINSMWSRTPWSCGKSARCGQAIDPEKFAPYVPKIVLISWPTGSRRQRGPRSRRNL